MAGKLLARRMFQNSAELMDYDNVATAVFTPLELGTVGLSEEAAKEKYGADAVESYLSEFVPLEWSVLEKADSVKAFTKIVVHKANKNKVLGLHIAAPNAGEIMQGYAVAIKKGITYEVSSFSVTIPFD